MPRVARIVVPGVVHHVTQRGNNRQQVFFSDDDRALYLALLEAEAERFGLEILGYCLMSNHMHLVGIPAGAVSLAKAVGRTDYRYTQAVNRSRGWSGHLWQNPRIGREVRPRPVGRPRKPPASEARMKKRAHRSGK